MNTLLVLAQAQPSDTSSAAAAVFGVVLLVGIFSIIALTSKGRRTLLPIVAVLLGLAIIVTTIADARNSTFSALTVLGFFFGGLLLIGGAGAVREGVALPKVEGVEPSIDPAPPRISPED